MVSIVDNRVYHKAVSFSCVDAITINDRQCETYVENDDLQRFCGMLPLVVNGWTPLLKSIAVEIIVLPHLDL